ncbi:MAG: polyphosphate kinase 2, partial [Acetobacteraceae bacterium]|nr:polyphosphate kinase 2 [Acetobacteraceae bacterium]
RDFLDRVPDTTVREDPVELPPLKGKPAKERYKRLEPIPRFEL